MLRRDPRQGHRRLAAARAARCTWRTPRATSSAPTASSAAASRTPSGSPSRRGRSARAPCAVAFFGDGAANQGTFHESLNLAAVWGAPVVFVCENNGYGEFSASESRHGRARHRPTRPTATASRGHVVDGNDVLAVHEATAAALARARAGDGPTLLECRCIRRRGHHEGEETYARDYRADPSDPAADPIDRLAARLPDGEALRDAALGRAPGGPGGGAGARPRRAVPRRGPRLRGRARWHPLSPRPSAARRLTPAMADAIAQAMRDDPRVVAVGRGRVASASWARPAAWPPSSARSGCATRRSPSRASSARRSARRWAGCDRWST